MIPIRVPDWRPLPLPCRCAGGLLGPPYSAARRPWGGRGWAPPPGAADRCCCRRTAEVRAGMHRIKVYLNAATVMLSVQVNQYVKPSPSNTEVVLDSPIVFLARFDWHFGHLFEFFERKISRTNTF